MKVVLSTDLRFIVFSSNCQEDVLYFLQTCANLNLSPRKHEVNKCTYADAVEDTVSGLFLHSEGFKASEIFLNFFDFLYSFIGSICHCCHQCSDYLQSL